MKLERIKKLVLLLLFMLLAYIWWGNFQTFYGPTSSSRKTQTVEKGSKISSDSTRTLDYRSPRVNPFRRSTPYVNQKNKTLAKNPPTKPPVRPGELYVLSGVLVRENQSQVVLRAKDGSGTMVLAVEDSVGEWRLKGISGNCAIFQHEKLYDSLWLQSKSR